MDRKKFIKQLSESTSKNPLVVFSDVNVFRAINAIIQTMKKNMSSRFIIQASEDRLNNIALEIRKKLPLDVNNKLLMSTSEGGRIVFVPIYSSICGYGYGRYPHGGIDHGFYVAFTNDAEEEKIAKRNAEARSASLDTSALIICNKGFNL